MTLPEIEGDPAQGDPPGIRALADAQSTIARELRARAGTARSALVPLEGAAASTALRPLPRFRREASRSARPHAPRAHWYADDSPALVCRLTRREPP